MAKNNGYVKLSTLKPNPDNPRIIKDDAFHKLVTNLLRLPKLLPSRPIIHKDQVIYAGNMRFKAMEHIIKMSEKDFAQLTNDVLKLDVEPLTLWMEVRKQKAVPDSWIANAADFDSQELKHLTIIDNVTAGLHDWDKLANDWDTHELEDWGLKIPDFSINKADDMLDVEPGTKEVTFTAKVAGATHDDYAVFDVLLHKDEKKKLVDLLDKVKDAQKYDVQSKAFMYIIDFFIQNNK